MQILCATDFSKSAMQAADVAVLLARALNLSLRLVHCPQNFLVLSDLPLVAPDDAVVRRQLSEEATRLRHTGVNVLEELRHGSPGVEVIEAAAEWPTKLVVMGSVGKGRVEHWLIGSVAERVAEGAPVPVLVVRQPDPLLDWLSHGSALRLLCGVDFTASAEKAMSVMKWVAGLGPIDVEASYIRNHGDSDHPKDPPVIHEREVRERLQAVVGEVPVEVHVRDVEGLPAAGFLKVAEERLPGLVIIGTHQRHGLQRIRAHSFSRRVLAQARTNVLCVPARPGAGDLDIPPIRRVLLTTDFSEVSEEALRHAYSLLPSGGTIHVVHVCPEPTKGINPLISSKVYLIHSIDAEKTRQAAAEQLAALPRHLMTVPGVSVTSEIITHHDTAAAICEAAARHGADVICMGTPGHSRAAAALLGSTLQSVISQVHIPVYVITPPLP
jgi:nucleotide-binding universal stress UspA family protein